MAGLGFKDFAVGEVLTSADVDGYLMQQTVMRFADASARGSALGTATGTAVPLAEGMVSYLDDANRLEAYNGTAWLPVGSLLQVVTATDSTNRSTSSTSFTDASISVSVTPKSASSTLYLIWSFSSGAGAAGETQGQTGFQITDSSDVALESAEDTRLRINYSEVTAGQGIAMLAHVTLVGSVSAASTSARTYKGRFKRVAGSNAEINNATNTGRLMVLEVA